MPALNEALTLRDLAIEILALGHSLVVVDDASTDGTTECVADLPLIFLRNDCRLGKSGSLWKGFRYALSQNAKVVATMDADGQHHPEELAKLLSAWGGNCECLVIGSRNARLRQAKFWRYFANCLADACIALLSHSRLDDSQSGFRLYPPTLLRRLEPQSDRWATTAKASFVFETEVLVTAIRLGFPIISVPVASSMSTRRPSHFQPLRDSLRIGIALLKRFLTGRP